MLLCMQKTVDSVLCVDIYLSLISLEYYHINITGVVTAVTKRCHRSIRHKRERGVSEYVLRKVFNEAYINVDGTESNFRVPNLVHIPSFVSGVVTKQLSGYLT